MTIELKVLHVDPEFVVIDKPAGFLSVPGRGPDKQDCVTGRVKQLFPGCLEQPAVHRLDMDTSGLMVLARTREAHRILSLQFSDRQVCKRYQALLAGLVQGEQGEIELAFRLDPEKRPHQVYDPVQGKLGVTHWRKLGVEDGMTRVEFIPRTGRTHQLRLHAAHELGLGCPIIGDRLYGIRKPGQRMLLHAEYLSFAHPEAGDALEFFSTAPF